MKIYFAVQIGGFHEGAIDFALGNPKKHGSRHESEVSPGQEAEKRAGTGRNVKIRGGVLISGNIFIVVLLTVSANAFWE